MRIPGRNAAVALENASSRLRVGMETARRGSSSLPELCSLERQILHRRAERQDLLFKSDPTVSLARRQSRGEHVVECDHVTSCWWKMHHPGNFFQTAEATIPIDGIITRIVQPAEHAWLMDRVETNR